MEFWLDSVCWCGKRPEPSPSGPSSQVTAAASLWLLIIVIGVHFCYLLSIILVHGDSQPFLLNVLSLRGLHFEGSLCNPICSMGC